MKTFKAVLSVIDHIVSFGILLIGCIYFLRSNVPQVTMWLVFYLVYHKAVFNRVK